GGFRVDRDCRGRIARAGGAITDYLDAEGDVTWSGGGVAEVFLDYGMAFTIAGGHFELDGVPILGLSTPGSEASFEVPGDAVLSGVLGDGTPFVLTETDIDRLGQGTIVLQRVETPEIGPASVVVDGEVAPHGVRNGQTLTVEAGGVLPGSFTAGPGSTVYVQAGATVGANFEAHQADVEISGGTVGEDLDVFIGASVHVTGGVIGGDVQVHEGGVLTLLGGQANRVTVSSGALEIGGDAIVNSLDIVAGSSVNIHGGRVDHLFTDGPGTTAQIVGGIVEDGVFFGDGTTATIDGGVIERELRVRDATVSISGGEIRGELEVVGDVTLSGGTAGERITIGDIGILTLEGDAFRVNGVPVTGLNEGQLAAIALEDTVELTGTLADGTPFAFNTVDGDLIGNRIVRLRRTPIEAIPSIINAPVDPIPLGVSDGQTLFASNGAVIGSNFSAGQGSRVVIGEGATVGDNFEVAGATVEVQGGTIGERFDAFTNSRVVVRAGSIGRLAEVHRGGELIVDGGTVDSSFRIWSGGRTVLHNGSIGEFATVLEGGLLVVSGGSVKDSLRVESGGVVSITGGEIEEGFTINGGTVVMSGGALVGLAPFFSTDFDFNFGSTLIVAATRFELDGVDITDTLSVGEDRLTTERNQPLTVYFADGTSTTLSLSTRGGSNDFYSQSADVLLRLIVPGDATADGIVDLDDYTAWAGQLGTIPTLPGDGADLNYDGRVDAADYAVWRDAYDATLSADLVPEPATLTLVIATWFVVGPTRRPSETR
ncbi:MAG: hypothetical protein AAF266_15540, partial [Planctomycetota bacterium]